VKSFRNYFVTTFRFDLVAGLTVSIVALPLALGFGVTSGAGASAGLATAIVAGFVAGILGGSRYQVSGPTGAMTVVLIPIVATHGPQALFAVGVLAGALIIAFGLLKWGRFIERVPWSVMEGFTLGIALVIAIQQLPLIFDVPRGEGAEALVSAGNTLATVAATSLNVLSIAVVVGTLVVKLTWPALSKALRLPFRLPASAIAVIVMTAFVVATQLPISRIGDLPGKDIFHFTTAWPTTIGLGAILYAAVVVALLGAVESLLSARVADAMVNRRDQVEISRYQPNRELIGQGFATFASALFGGMPATGAIARTGVNVHAGARTRGAAIIHAMSLLVLVFALAPLVSLIPTAVLAGVLLGTSWRIANPRSIKEALQTTWPERISYLVTALAVVVIDLIIGTIIGIVVHYIATRFFTKGAQ